MKYAILLLVMFNFLSNSWSAQEDLNSFCKELDKSLRRINKSTQDQCTSPSTPYPSAKSVSYKNKKASALTEQDAAKVFTEMQSHTELAFNFTYDGCIPRSHEMSRLMMLQGVKPLMGFMWIDENKAPRLRYTDPEEPKRNAEWTNHQAPIVLVKSGNKLVPYVIDPSTQKGPVTYEAWKKSLSKHDRKIKVLSEIGDTGQYAPGSPFMYDYNNKETNDMRTEKLKQLKERESQSDGVEQYKGEMMMELEDYSSKIDAMSSGN